MPEWKPAQLTDGELINRKSELEGKLKVFMPGSPRETILHGELDAVTAEQQDRKKTRTMRQARLAGLDQ